MNESELQRTYNCNIYPRDSNIITDRGLVSLDKGSMGGSHWTCFIVKDSESFYFDSFGGQPDKFVLIQIPQPKTYHNYEIHDIYSTLCGSYFL